MIDNNLLPVPLKYTQPLLMQFCAKIVRSDRPGKISTRMYYYIPEVNKWYKHYDFLNYFKVNNIDYNEWENRWIIHSDLYSEDWLDKVIEYRYKDKPKWTKLYIKDQLRNDKNYKCDFYILGEDLPEMYNKSRENLFKVNYNYSNVPKFIISPRTKIDLLYENDKIYKCTVFSLIVEHKDVEYYKYKKISIAESLGLETFINKARSIHGDRYDYSYIKEYVNNRTQVLLYDNLYNEFFYITPDNHLQGGGNPNASNRSSRGEQLILTWLRQSPHINYWEKEKRIKEKIPGINLVIIDYTFTLNNKLFWIEYNGIQHYKYTPIFHKDLEEYNRQLIRDRSIRDYCKKNNIELIEIPYILDTFNKIDEFLDKVLFKGIDPSTLIDYNKLFK